MRDLGDLAELALDATAATAHVDSPPELEIARDMAKRAVWVGPVLVALCSVVWGLPNGTLSSLYGVAIVVVNFVLAAALLAWAAKVSPTMIMAAALGGFLVRMGLIVAAVLLVKPMSWVALPALLFTILVTHMGLLVWETKYVSATLAHPGLKPARKGA